MKNKLFVVTPANCTPIPSKGYLWAVEICTWHRIMKVPSFLKNLINSTCLGSFGLKHLFKTSVRLCYAPMFIFENRTWTAKLFQCFRIVEDEQKILAILKHLSYEALRALEVW